MFKKGSYNVKKASDKNETKEKKPSTQPKLTANPNMTLKKKEKKKESSAEPKMTLKKKAEIKNVSKQESPEYRKKSHPKNFTTNKRWVGNSTFKPK